MRTPRAAEHAAANDWLTEPRWSSPVTAGHAEPVSGIVTVRATNVATRRSVRADLDQDAARFDCFNCRDQRTLES